MHGDFLLEFIQGYAGGRVIRSHGVEAIKNAISKETELGPNIFGPKTIFVD